MVLDFEEIKKVLPQRFPFLMIDKVIAFEKGKSITAIKNITGNEIHFLGHFPERALMPGALMLEAAAQASAILMVLSNDSPDPGNKKAEEVLFGSINKARFLSPVVPGDQLRIETEVIKLFSTAGITRSKLYVGDKLVVTGEMSFARPASPS
jgi:3-hydroxyacyl-[acyl-carrier-protein] dehydratase